MKRAVIVLTLVVLAAALLPSPAFAAKPVAARTAEYVGYDVSYPQCNSALPKSPAFAIIGINGGNAANTNACLSTQLSWAATSVGGTAQPKSQLYVNTANPGEVISQITTWPTNNTDPSGYTPLNPYGTCAGANDLACSWQYGWNRAVQDVTDRLVPAAQSGRVSQLASSYTWWLDVETSNTWQSGSTTALARNTAALEGMTAHFKFKGAKVGLYSTAVQWNAIVGSTVSSSSKLNGLGNWRPSGSSLDNAKANCSVKPFTTGGFISLTQYVQQSFDRNHSCI